MEKLSDREWAEYQRDIEREAIHRARRAARGLPRYPEPSRHRIVHFSPSYPATTLSKELCVDRTTVVMHFGDPEQTYRGQSERSFEWFTEARDWYEEVKKWAGAARLSRRDPDRTYQVVWFWGPVKPPSDDLYITMRLMRYTKVGGRWGKKTARRPKTGPR